MQVVISRLVVRGLLAAILGFFVLPSQNFAQQQPAGVVTGIQGQAELTRPAAKPAPLRFRDGVVIRDVVDTREKSLARILFGGRSTVTVRELSRLQVTEEVLPTGARRDVHDLSSGAILVNVARQLMKPGDEVQIKTPNAVAAIRGSTVFGSFNPVLNQSFFAVLSGSGTVTPQGLPPVTLAANTPNNGANVSGTGPTVQVTVVNVPPAQANQIIAESQVAKVVKEEAAKEQTVQAAAKEAAQLAQAVVEAVTKTEQLPTQEGAGTQEAPKESESTSTTAPVTPETSTDQPDVAISGTKNLTAAETPLQTKSGKSFESSGSRSGITPVVKITDATVTQASGDNDSLIHSQSGSNWTLAGALLEIKNSEINNVSSPNGLHLVQVDGSLTGNGVDPFITLNPSKLKTKEDIVNVSSTGSLTVKGPLFTDSGGTITAGISLLNVESGTVTGKGTDPFIQFNNTNFKIEGGSTPFDLVSMFGGTLDLAGTMFKASGATVTVDDSILFTDAATVKGTGSGAYIQITGSSTVKNLDSFPLIDLNDGTVTLSGPMVTVDSSTVTTTQEGIGIDGTTVTSSSTSPFAQFTSSTLTIGTNLMAMVGGSVDTSGPLLKISGGSLSISGDPLLKLTSAATIEAGGSLLDITNLNLNLGDPTVAGTDHPVVRLEGGSTLKNTSGPVIKISGGSLKADALGTTDGAGNKFQLTGTLLDLSNNTEVTLRKLGEDPTSSTDANTFTLAANEPWIKMVNSKLTLTGTTENVLIELDADEFGTTFKGIALDASGSTLTLPDGLMDMEGTFSSTSTSPLIQLTNTSKVENTDDLIAVDFVTGGTDITLAGQLVKSSGSTWTVKSRDQNTVSATIVLGAQPIDSIAVIQDRATTGRLNRAYVPIPGSDVVKVINTDTNAVVATINVGDNPVTVRAASNDDRVLVLNRNSNNVSIINTHTNAVVATLSVGTTPEEVGFSPHDNRAYVINQGSDDVTVIDLDNNVVLVASIGVGDQPVSGAVSKKGGNAYVTNSASNNVSVINTDTGTVVATISVGTKPVAAALNPDETRLYVINETSGTVSVINTNTNAVIATITVGTTPTTGALKPDGSKGYVVNEGSNNVSVIDTSTNTVTKTITVGTSPHDIAINRDGKRAYVANEGSNNVSVIDTANDTVVGTINVGTSPTTLATTQDGVQLFVVNEGSNNVTSIATVDVADFLVVSGGAKLTGNGTSPFLEFNPSSVTVDGAVVRVTGSGSNLTLAGPLLKGTDTDFDVSRGAVRVRGGGTLKGTGTGAFIQLTGTAADKSFFDTTYAFINVEGTNSTLDLAGPLLSAVKTAFSAGVEGDPAQFLFFQEGAIVKSTSSSPFMTFDNSKLEHGSRFLELARSPDNAAAAAKLEIAGPLLEAKNSSSFETDRDFVRVTEKATLKGTGTTPLLQFTGSTELTTTGNLGNADFFLIDNTTGESAQGAASVELAGGLFTDTGGTFTIADRFLNVRDGATLTSTSSDPLIKLSGTTLSTERDLVQIDGSGSKITLSGSLLSAGSTLNIGNESDVSGNLLNIHDGGQLVMNTTSSPVILFTGGTHTIGTGDSTTNDTPNFLVRLKGVNTNSTTGLGTDQTIKGPASSDLSGATNPTGTLLKATDAATIEVKKGSGDTAGGHGIRIDTALYEATLPVLDLIGSSTTETKLTTASSTLDIFKSKVVANGPLVAMDKSFINVTNGAFIHIRNGSLVDITGDLLKLINGAKIEVINGPLILVSGTSSTGSSPAVSELKVSGALVNFGGSGNNKIIVNNSLCSGSCATKGGTGVQAIQVLEGNSSSISIGSNPIKNSSSGSIQYQGSNTALIQTGSTGKVNITAP